MYSFHVFLGPRHIHRFSQYVSPLPDPHANLQLIHPDNLVDSLQQNHRRSLLGSLPPNPLVSLLRSQQSVQHINLPVNLPINQASSHPMHHPCNHPGLPHCNLFLVQRHSHRFSPPRYLPLSRPSSHLRGHQFILRNNQRVILQFSPAKDLLHNLQGNRQDGPSGALQVNLQQ